MTKQEVISILQKYHDGTSSPEEKALLETWYADYARRQEDMPFPGDLWARKEAGLQQIFADSAHLQHKKISVFYRYRWAAAAAILMIFGTAVYLYTNIMADRWQTGIYASDIQPGGNRAVLTLSNGKKISLTDARNGDLAEQSGIRVTKTADGQLVYTVHDKEAGAELGLNTIETPPGGEYRISLPDGTKVWLNAASSLRFPATFAGLNERKVELSGEAYFEVNHNAKQPFRVHTKGQLVEDIGTAFNIHSYADEATKTTLIEGSVRVNSSILKPGQQSILNGEALQISVADTEEAIAWKNGYFKFNDDLQSMMNKIARWYNVQVVYEVKNDPDQLFGAKISRTRSLSEVLKIIESTGGIHFKTEGRRVTVMK